MSESLADVHRALCRDATHVVLVVDAPLPADLADSVACEIRDEARVEVVPLAGLDAAGAGRRLLAALGLDPAERQPEIRARIELELLAKQRTSQVLVVPDALEAEPAALRWLGDVARTAPGRALRLALLAACSPSDPDPTPALVGTLGTGAAKIELGERGRRSIPEPLPEPVAAGPALPPLVTSTRPRRVRPIPVRDASSRRRRRRRSAGLALAAVVLVAAPAAIVTRESGPTARTAPVASAASAASDSASRRAVSRPAPAATDQAAAPEAAETRTRPSPATPLEPGASLTASAPPAAGTVPPPPVSTVRPVREDAPASPKTLPTPPPSVRVNFNASPWADIEVDGRPVGPTPIADLVLAAGMRHVRATFPDGRVVERDLRVGALENRFRIE